MSADLLARLRAARETWATVGGREFLLRRPTDVQLLRISRAEDEDLLRLCLVGWRGITLAELVPGGDGAPAPFELDAAVEWLEDRPQLYTGVCEAIVDLLNGRIATLAESEKN